MKGRPEIGVYLKEARPLIAIFKALMIESSELIDAELCRPDRDRVTVFLSNHGSFISPFPAPVLTAEYLLKQGGYDDLVAVTLFHTVAEYLPGLSPVLRRYFGHSTQKLRSLPGLIEMMKARQFHLIGTTPEARSAVFYYNHRIGPFTKFGLMVAALEAGADIVLTAQKGVEVFGFPAQLPLGLTLPLGGRPRGLLLPLWYPGRKARVRVKYGRYQPLISAEERASLSRSARRAQNQEDFVLMHEQLVALYDSIPEIR